MFRLGRLCARHRFVAVLVWLLVAVSAVLLVRALGAKTNNSLTLPGTDSQRAFDVLARRFPPQQNGTNPFVFHVDQGRLSDDRNRAALKATYRAFKSSDHVYSVVEPFSKGGQAAGLVSGDERTAFMPVLLDLNSGFITDQLANKTLDATTPARRAGMEVAVGGSIGSVLSAPDTKTSTLLGNIAAMVILALVFGSLVAMGTPILNAAIALTIAISVVGLLGHVTAVSTVAPTLATMIGLGVGIDYALFLVTKHLDQLESGVEVRESIARAVSTSGGAVVFAGGSVVIALVSLSVAGIPLVTTLGIASAIAVLCAVLTSITLLPAILSLLGGSVRRLRIPSFLRPRRRPEGHTRWDAWARGVGRHPWWAVGVSLAILVPLIIPLFSLELGQEDIGVTPKNTTERRAYDLLTAGFGVGYNGPLLVAMELDPKAKPSAEYTRKHKRALRLQRELKREQRRLNAEADHLRKQQAALERQQASLERQADALRRQEAQLEAEEARLLAEEARLRSQAEQLLRRAAPIVAHLAVIEVRERVLERRIESTDDPGRRKRLKARLARLREREQELRRRLAPLEARGRQLFDRALALEAQADQAQAKADQLRAEGDELTAEGNELQAEGDELQAQAAKLRREEAKAKRQKKTALTLKRQLTRMLTKAGGDPRATDPRIVGVQDALTGATGVVGLFPPQVNKTGDAATVSAIPERAPSSDATANLVIRLRDHVLPDATRGTGVSSFVGGSTASNVDLAAKISQRLLLVITVVILLSMVLLLLAFRSLVVPLQAAVTNLLCVAAALGVLTACFQWGWGLDLIGLDAPRGTVPIASYVPLMMFAVLFGLSMDYEVFTVSRIEQRHTPGASPRDAVVTGLGAAAHVVTAAAFIMICVFASFIINGDPTIKQFGVGLSVAVLLAGTMVVLLAPALLVIFGSLVFRLPRFLDRLLPHLDVEGGAAPTPDAEKEQSTEAVAR